MRPKRWFLALIRAVVVVVLTLVLAPGASAKPKFKVLQRVAGGLSGGLVFDTKGNLYGATCAGGVGANGTIFKLSRSKNWAQTTLHVFGGGSDGYCPNGGLIFDPQGNLYGTTALGGLYRGGEVFELIPGKAPVAAWTFGAPYSFCEQYGCPDGAAPNAGVVLDAQGNLFGTATGGGSNGGGVVFELSPGSGEWTYTVLHDFGPENSYGDGYLPTDALTFDDFGNLYGTTGGGGRYDLGTVFRLHNGGNWKESLLYSFCEPGFPCEDGAGPTASVIFNESGNLYGITPGGGENRCGEANCGVVFTLARKRGGGWRETVLHSFKLGATGYYPSNDGRLALNESGILYGTTTLGGLNDCGGGCGVIYELRPESYGKWRYAVLHEFNAADGGYPDGGVILDKKGNLYGNADTVVFELTP